VRNLTRLDRALRAGEWSVTTVSPGLRRPSATTFAVIGFGRIGSRVARAASVMGFRVIVCDPYVAPDAIRDGGHEPVDLQTSLKDADILSLHLPLTAESRHLLDATAFAQIKRGCVIVNTSRGELIDEGALLEALRTRRIGGAALDAFATEPLPMDSPLLRFPNVRLTPHASWYSVGALSDLWSSAATNVVDFLAARPSESLINPAYVEAAAELSRLLE
jgi:D-3-phosphoglycerate dehydrogenase